MRAPVLLAAALVAGGCGGEDRSRPTAPPPPLGSDLESLPRELLGSWDGRGGDTVFRTTYRPASDAICRDRSTRGVGCYTVRAVRGAGASSKAEFEWGPAGLRGGRLVTIPLVAGKPSCARQPTTVDFAVRGDRLVLTATHETCLGDRPGDRAVARRSAVP